MEVMTEKELLTCVDTAIRAPSIHNTQPWLFLPVPDGVEVHADVSRLLAAIDPQGRAMHIGLGAAVLNLRLAVAAIGREPHVRLLPSPPSGRWHVATVTLGGPRTPGIDELELFAAVPRRHTSRCPFSEVRPPQSALERLREAASQEGAVLRFTDSAERDELLSLARTAEAFQRGSAIYRAELRVWTTDDPNRADGVPINAAGPWPGTGSLPIRDFAFDREIPGRAQERFEHDPTVAVLAGIGAEEPALWLRAGMALERVLLEATRLGLSAGMFTQPLEEPDLRVFLDNPNSPLTTQAVLRIGYGPPVPATPRRLSGEVIVRSKRFHLNPLKPGS